MQGRPTPMTPAEHRFEMAIAALTAMLIEGLAVLLFFAAALLWCLVGSGRV